MNEGKKNDQEKPRMDLLSSKAIIEVARVLTFGAKKYDSHNWRKGIAFSRIIAAIYRHLAAYNDGETHDLETGLSHMAHVMCEAMFLLEFEAVRPEMDDRYKFDANVPISGKKVTYPAPKMIEECRHAYWAPLDENIVRCTVCHTEIDLVKENACL